MRNLIILAAAASTLALGGCAADMGAGADADVGMDASAGAAMSGDMTPTEKSAFTMMAASSDMFEIQSSQLALSNSQNPAIRQFAQMMVNDHTMMSQQLMAAAQAAGVAASPEMMPMHAQMLSQLQAGGAAGFDTRYAQAQVKAHEMALALHTNYARSGDNASLRAVATAAAPKVQQHLTMARQWPGQ